MLGITDACVMGVSLGGMIAQELAIRYSGLVKKLILGVTASRTNDTMTAAVSRWITFAGNGDFSGIVRDMMEVMYSANYAKRYGWMFPILAKFAKPKNEERFIRLAKACLTCDTYDRLVEISCPTLVLGGADDKIVTGEASLEIAEKIGCAFHLYEGLGHSAYEEAADFNERVYEFLRDTGKCG
jgi:pimeloyl-ACP methyl ester carboxylesterase